MFVIIFHVNLSTIIRCLLLFVLKAKSSVLRRSEEYDVDAGMFTDEFTDIHNG